MTRTTRNIVLGLIGSAMLFGCCFTSCVDVRDEEERDENGNVARHHRHYYFRPWYGYHGGSGWTYRPSYSPFYSRSYVAPAPSRSAPSGTGGGSRTTSSVTSRGGFGSTGHATTGG